MIRLVSVNLSFRLLVDKAPLGTSKGDTIQTTNALSNAVAQFGLAKGAVVGSDAGRETNVDAVPMTVDILVRLPKAPSTCRGRSRAVGQTRVAPVVGGTGQFKGATGHLTVAPIAHSARFVEHVPAALPASRACTGSGWLTRARPPFGADRRTASPAPLAGRHRARPWQPRGLAPPSGALSPIERQAGCGNCGE